MAERADAVVADRIARDLSRWERPRAARAELEPLVALADLRAWLDDAGRCSEGATDDWESLLDDVVLAWGSVGRHAQAAMPSLPGLLQRLDGPARGDLRRRTRGVDATTKATLDSIAGGLRAEGEPEAVLSGLIADVLAAAEHEQQLDALPADHDLRWQLVLLGGFAQAQGHDWGLVADRLRSAVGRDVESGGLPAADVLGVLAGPPEVGHSVVWVVIDHASVWGPSGLEPVVHLFDFDWLLGNLELTPSEQLVERGIPAELATDPERSRQAFMPRLEEELPVVLARVDLGVGRVEGARERALDTLELLGALASFEQGGTNWRISGARMHFVDGVQVFGSYGPIGDPDVYDRLQRADVLADTTSLTLRARGADLAPHLPVAGGRFREALELTRWLTVARQTWSPGRLVLAGRIIERCASWSERTPGQLLDELTLPWAWQRLEARIARVGRAAVLRMPGHDGTTSAHADREHFLCLSKAVLEDGRGRTPPVANPRRVVEHLDALLAAHASGSEVAPALAALDTLLNTGRATHCELARLTGEIGALRRRAKRTRNALVHGGPLNTDVVASVVSSQDQLASLALRWILGGQLTGDVLSAHVDRQAGAFHARMEALAQGAQPVEELFG